MKENEEGKYKARERISDDKKRKGKIKMKEKEEAGEN